MENEMLRQRLANCDETTLATIETTFGKFNDFLKALHQMGYGHIIDGYKDPAAANVPFIDTQLSTKNTIPNTTPQVTTNTTDTSRVQQEKKLLKSNSGNGNTNLDNSHPSTMSANTGKSVNGSGAQKTSRSQFDAPQFPVEQKNIQKLNENHEVNNFSISSTHTRNDHLLSLNFSRMSMSSPVESLADITLSDVRF